MNKGLQIPENGGLDFVSVGAMNHRVDPGIIPFRKATEWQVHPSGGEYNVAANLANCFGCGVCPAMVTT
jgi:2-dehydro-3-deoxygluconokinase